MPRRNTLGLAASGLDPVLQGGPAAGGLGAGPSYLQSSLLSGDPAFRALIERILAEKAAEMPGQPGILPHDPARVQGPGFTPAAVPTRGIPTELEPPPPQEARRHAERERRGEEARRSARDPKTGVAPHYSPEVEDFLEANFGALQDPTTIGRMAPGVGTAMDVADALARGDEFEAAETLGKAIASAAVGGFFDVTPAGMLKDLVTRSRERSAAKGVGSYAGSPTGRTGKEGSPELAGRREGFGREPADDDDDDSGGFGCFVAGTEVLLPDDQVKPIEAVELGEQVMAFNHGGPLVPQTVTGRYQHLKEPLIRLNGHTLVTPGHPFLCRTAGEKDFDWCAAGNLKVGDLLMDAGGLATPVTAIEPAGEGMVYNLQVAECHTYIADGYRVHNIKHKGGYISEDRVPGVKGADVREILKEGEYVLSPEMTKALGLNNLEAFRKEMHGRLEQRESQSRGRKGKRKMASNMSAKERVRRKIERSKRR